MPSEQASTKSSGTSQNGTGLAPEAGRQLSKAEARDYLDHEIEDLEAIPLPPPILREVRALQAQAGEIERQINTLVRVGLEVAEAPRGYVCYHPEIGYTPEDEEEAQRVRQLGEVAKALHRTNEV